MSQLLDAFKRNFEANQAAFNRHDFETAFAALPDDVIWEPMPHVVDRDRLEGKRAVIDAFRALAETWPDWRTELAEITEPTPGLIQMRFRGIGTSQLSGVRTETQFIQEWDFRSQPMEVREYPV